MLKEGGKRRKGMEIVEIESMNENIGGEKKEK